MLSHLKFNNEFTSLLNLYYFSEKYHNILS